MFRYKLKQNNKYKQISINGVIFKKDKWLYVDIKKDFKDIFDHLVDEEELDGFVHGNLDTTVKGFSEKKSKKERKESKPKVTGTENYPGFLTKSIDDEKEGEE